MIDDYDKTSNLNDDYVIDLLGLIKLFWSQKKFIIIFTSFSAILSIFIALSLPVLYKSTAKVFPNSDSMTQSSSLGSQLGGLASLAGIEIGTSANEVTLAIETMKSYNFFKEYLYDEILPELSAQKSWSQENGLEYDEKIYNSEMNEWIKGKPSFQDAYRSYSGLVEITENKLTKIISITVINGSPHVAKNWVDLIIKQINMITEKEEIKRASKALAYYEERLGSTPLLSVNEMFAKLTEDQHKRLMLAEVEDEYILRTIEPAVAPERRFKPSRAKFCIVFTFIAGVISLILVFLWNSFRKSVSNT